MVQDSTNRGQNDSQTAKNMADRARGYLREFDQWILVLITLGLASALIYGAAAGTYDACAARATPVALPTPAALAASLRTVCGNVNHLGGALLALIFALAAMMVGALLGFLFGLPRTFTGETPRKPMPAPSASGTTTTTSAGTTVTANASSGDDEEDEPGHGLGAGVNTNLERISNWLTTIIVGVGLTKIEEVPRALESFGREVDAYFGFGGHLFAVGGGLFFLIAGFFLSYVGTRVKLSAVFLDSQITNKSAVDRMGRVVAVSLGAEPVTLAKQYEQNKALDPAVHAADADLLGKSLADLKTDDQILAWANAKSRAGDFSSAIVGYRDVLKRAPLTEDLARRFAMILARSGDEAEAMRILDAARTTASAATADDSKVREQVSAVSLQTRLREGLYRPFEARGYEDSIVAGTELLKDPAQAKVGINRLWLACAYAQKLRALNTQMDAAADPAEAVEVKRLAVEEVLAAAAADPTLKSLIADLYDPARQKGADNDLQSLYRTPAIDDLIAS